MFSAQPIIIFLFITILVLVLALVILLVALERIFMKLHQARVEEEGLKSHMSEASQKALDDAHTQALGIVQDAYEKAKGIIAGNKDLEAQMQKMEEDSMQKMLKQYEESMQKLSQDVMVDYQQVWKQLKQINSNNFVTITKEIEKSALSEVEDFKNVLHTETIASQKIVQDKIDASYNQVQKELEEYKAAQLKVVDNQIQTLIEKTTSLVLGKAMSLSDHQALVQTSLKEAKRKIEEREN